ncbi:MAG TPA: hypothetical protein VFI25_14465 [Planctomycetota bacterium]|jgi:hypothetical protein|nr:hypothetical protein [Planctomycetota bacterium]
MKAPLLTAVSLLALLVGCRFVDSDHQRIGEVEGSAGVGSARRLVVRNNVGDVTVRTDAEATVSARAVVYHRGNLARRTAEPADLRVRVDGDAVLVENAHLDEADHDDWKMEIEVSAPPGLDVQLETGVGDLEVSIRGEGPFEDLDCRTGVGDLTVEVPASFGGAVRLDTGVGGVEVVNAPGLHVTREAVSASAAGKLGTGDGRVTAKTGTGGITFRRR